MTERHLIFIVNEFSTKGKKSSHEIRQTMQRYSNDYEIHLTQYKQHATALAEQLAAGIQKNSLIVAVGGDGTLNEVVKGLVNGNHSLPLAYVPTGSGNDFARSMNLPLTIEGSIRNIMETEQPKVLDVLAGKSESEDIVAVNSIGFGLDGMVIYKIDQTKNKQTIGKFSYLASVLSAYFYQKSFPLKLVIEQQTFTYKDAILIVCANNKFFGGGIPIHPQAVPH
ncbi:MAG: diacylglycerol kinase family protein [Alkalibacterium sp.]|nr:diacylglycerol kinase family protein [Alkalibacterium sp.]